MLLYGFVWFGRNSEAEVKTINEWKRLCCREWKRLWSDLKSGGWVGQMGGLVRWLGRSGGSRRLVRKV